jgi:hypothetical protein
MIATKDQERKAIEEIRKIVDNLGENSYVGAAMEGVLELAEDNIENDFVQSMKESVETAEKRAHELEEELEEARACILPEEVRQKFYGIAFDKKYKAQAEAMTAAEAMAEAVECGENARPDAIRYRAMTEEVKEWKDIIKLLDNIAKKQAGR